MNSDTKIGLGVVVLIALCCAGPVILSLLASGAVLGALSAVWAGGRLLLLPGIALVVAAVWLLTRRRSSQAGDNAACCPTPASTADTAEASHASPDGVPVESGSTGQRS